MTPAEKGFAMPAEWAPQSTTWLSWPVDDPRHWGGLKRDLIWAKFAEIAAAISHRQPVSINAPENIHPQILNACNRTKADTKNVRLYNHSNNDVWCRDHGPIFVKNQNSGELAITDWEFNAWGGKFAPWDLDNQIPRKVAECLNLPLFKAGIILEGGAIEVNGHGQLLTTEAVLLNPNRNPNFSKQEIEQRLCDFLGVSDILWLAEGVEGDDTDGHIDDIARFTNQQTVIACTEKDKNSSNHRVFTENFNRLKEMRIGGSPLNLVEMHLPQACEVPGWRLPTLPASYVNFLILNGAVLMPTFRQPKNDARAADIIHEQFPDREIVAIDCLDLVEEGGTLHCISQQQPA